MEIRIRCGKRYTAITLQSEISDGGACNTGQAGVCKVPRACVHPVTFLATLSAASITPCHVSRGIPFFIRKYDEEMKSDVEERRFFFIKSRSVS